MKQIKSASLFEVWKESLSDKTFKISMVITFISLPLVLIVLSNFLLFNETRIGVIVDDPFLKLFKAINLNRFIFTLIYGGIILGIIFLIKHPRYFLFTLQSYAIMVIFRMIVMYSLPLDPPVGMISLNDPFVQLFGSGVTLQKDLFFSGHTSTMFLLFLTAVNKKMRFAFLIGTVIVGLSVLLQHTHYTVDVLAAPFFSYTSYRIAKIFNQKTGLIPLK